MVIVIPAAGRGQRFVQSGFPVPKPYLLAKDVPMIRRVVEMCGKATPRTIAVVTLRGHEPFLRAALHTDAHGGAYTRDYVRMCVIGATPPGAALSAFYGALAVGVEEDEEVLVVNSDNLFADNVFNAFVRDAQYEATQKTIKGSILCFPVDPEGPCIWSYAHDGYNGYVSEVTEKINPSPYATAGAYYFATWKCMREALSGMFFDASYMPERAMRNGEFYLAPAYNYLGMCKTKRFMMRAEDFIPLGTPEQLAEYNK